MNPTVTAKLLRSIGARGLFILGLLAPAAKAVVFYSTADTTYNTTAPSVSGTPTDGGWQWVGYWGSFQAAPIDAHHFIAADHIGGTVGDTFTYQGVNYTTVNTFKDSSTDLRIWEVRQGFPSWASLYTSNNEYGRTLLVFGRGITRGSEVRTSVATSSIPAIPAGTLSGWYWGSYDGKLRWGQNIVGGTATPVSSFGQQLYATFDQSGGNNECDLGSYDSSAPVFINDGTSWKLAGVAGLVQGGYSLTSNGSTFSAFIFDGRGLYLSGTQVSGTSAAPATFFATRISVRASWIASILAQSLTPTVTLGNLSQTYDGNPHAATVSTDPTNLTVSVTYNGSTTVPAAAGSYAVVATVSGSSTQFAPSSTSTSYAYSGNASGTLTIAPASQTISFSSLTTKAYGDAAFNLTATASSGLPATYSSSNNAVATIAGSTVTIVGAGTTTITASQTGNANYLAASAVNQTLTVAKATQSISFNPLTPVNLGDAAFALSATTSSGLPITYSSSNTAVANLSGSTVTLVGPGSTTITADQAGDSNYYGAPSVSQVLVVNAAQAAPNNHSGDVPTLPLWGTALLSALMLFIGSRILKLQSIPGTR